ncbi:MAG: hypothetical protein AABX66_01225 [Nanoarchaeota archaeon]
MPKEYDLYSLVGVIVAIALAILSPTMPSIITTLGVIGLIAIFIVVMAIVILINVYLKSKKDKEILKNKIEIFSEENKKTQLEINFLKERFKTLEDLARVKVELEYLKRTKNERRK